MEGRDSSQSLKPLLSAKTSGQGPSSEKLSGKRHTRRYRHDVLQPKVYMAVFIILGQSIFLFGGWGFYAATRMKATALPDSLSITIREFPQSLTFVVTLIATIITIICSFLYSHAIRYAVSLSLSRPMSLFALSASMKMANKKPILNFRRLKWTIAALICVAAVSAQTAGWTTLLTPRGIGIETGVTGFGADLSNEQFLAKVVDDFDTTDLNRRLDPDLLIAISPVIVDSAVAGVTKSLNRTASFAFNEMTYYGTTGGTLLVNFAPILSAVSRSIGGELPVNVEMAAPIRSPADFKTNYTVTQQGLTADVQCSQPQLDETSTPGLTVQRSISSPLDEQDLLMSQVDFVCRDGVNQSSRHITFRGVDPNVSDAIFTTLCTLNNNTIYELMLVGTSNYDWVLPTLCTISPKVTQVEVHYSQAQLSASIMPDLIQIDEPWEILDLPIAGYAPAKFFERSMETSQSLSGHTIGDALASFYFAQLPGAVGQNATQLTGGHPEVLNPILDAAIKSAIEFGGTITRAAYTESTNIFFSEQGEDPQIPQEFRYNLTGTIVTETFGWHQTTTAVPGVLLAPTFITGLSIFLVAFTLLRTLRQPEADGSDYFDLGNILHVVTAASVGTFRDPFPDIDADEDEQIAHNERVAIRLGHVEGGTIGFIQHSAV